MKVKELIEALQHRNPEADVRLEVNQSGWCEPGVSMDGPLAAIEMTVDDNIIILTAWVPT